MEEDSELSDSIPNLLLIGVKRWVAKRLENAEIYCKVWKNYAYIKQKEL